MPRIEYCTTQETELGMVGKTLHTAPCCRIHRHIFEYHSHGSFPSYSRHSRRAQLCPLSGPRDVPIQGG